MLVLLFVLADSFEIDDDEVDEGDDDDGMLAAAAAAADMAAFSICWL